MADPEARVHRAIVRLPYIRRDVENEIRTYLASGQPVLLVGPSMVGKTRIAATLIKEMLPTRDLLIPDSKDALVSLGAPAATLRENMIFLDDIDRLIVTAREKLTGARFPSELSRSRTARRIARKHRIQARA